MREVFAQLAAGKSAYSIAKALDKRGLRPSPEARWDGARMIEIARNPAYIGKLVHQGEIIGDAVWDGLVDAAETLKPATRSVRSCPAPRAC